MNKRVILNMNCLYCNKLFITKRSNRRFCSRSCAISYRNTIFSPRKDTSKYLNIKKYCIICGKELQGYGKFFRTYCSLSCASKDKKPWNKGLSKEIDERVRKYGETWSKKSKAQFANGRINPMFGKVAYPKPRFIPFLNHFVRSTYEEIVCVNLKKNNIKYEYEPKAYKLSINGKTCTYTPDLKVDNKFIEVKGYLPNWQIPKLLEFAKNHTILIIGGIEACKKLSILGFKCFLYDDILSNNVSINSILEV